MNSLGEFAIKVALLNIVLALLPMSPFAGMSYLLSNIPYLDYLNWFLPISEMSVIFESWLVVLAVYYSILYLLNYTGVIKS